MPTVSNFNLSTTSPSTRPYIYNFDQQNQVSSILNNCNGSITNVGITGGTAPYNITWQGPGGFTGNSLNLMGLCAGIYTATTRDINANTNTEYIEILNLSAGTFSASTIDDSCLNNISEYCKIRVHTFNHNQDNFTYILYKDGNLLDTYEGTNGQEVHDFVNLEPGNYTLSAYDGSSVDYRSIVPSNPCCLDGYTLDSENYGQILNTYTGLSAVHIVNEFYKMNLKNDFIIAFGNTYGPQPNFSPIPAGSTIVFETGLKPDGTIDTDDPYVWLYTGETVDRKTDNNSDWYLGALDYPMLDGQQNGPTGLNTVADVGKFYFNTAINKFVIRAQALGGAADSWATIHAFGDRGNTYSPIANDLLTGTSFYTTSNAVPTGQIGYTVTGTTNDSVEWQDLTGVSNSIFIIDNNANHNIYTFSECSYLNYTHQLSIGSSFSDDDTIGIILAGFVDKLGLYGPPNAQQFITLQFNNVSDINSVALYMNPGDNSAFAFMDPDRKVVNCGNETITGCVTSAGINAISGYTSSILTRPRQYSPFANGNYINQGSTFVRITREGPLGEQFKIQMTELSKSTTVGTELPFVADYEINFNLLDKNTWAGESKSAKDYDWVPNDGLQRFLGSQHIGYLQGSQRKTSIYNVGFTGTQSNYISSLSNFGGSQTQSFSLYNPDLNGVQMSLNKELEFYSSIGGGAEVGKPTVPKVQPKPSVLIQTTEIPIMSFTGGTKVSASTKDYKIYTNKDYLAQPEYEGGDERDPQIQDPCIELTFRWDKNATNLIDGNMLPYYSVHAYSPEKKRFLSEPLNLRIFDNNKNVKYVMNNTNQVIGEALQATDCLNFSPLQTNSEFLVKPNYIFKNKLDNLETTSCGVIPPPTGDTSGYTASERWYDTFESNPDLVLQGGLDSTGSFSWDQDGTPTPRLYGLYDPATDFYFITTPQVNQPDLKTSEIEYGKPNECGKLLTEQHVVMSAYTSGTTTMPLLVSGSPYNIVLGFPAGGTPQVTLNGLTLFASQDEDFDDDGDYYFNGTQLLTFRADILQPEDLINIIYVPGTFERSYYFDNYVVPATIPHLSGGTSISGNTLYTDSYYYYFKMTYEPIGDIGLVLNGSILTQNSDFKLISSDTVQFTGILYPTGLQENDVISQFYFTRITLQGTAGVKNPQVVVGIDSLYGYEDILLLIVRNTEGTIVYTETQKCNLDTYGSIEKIFTITVPEPGDYTYSVVRTVNYTLINGDEVSNSDTSPSYKFKIPAAIFYGSTGYN